MRPLQLPLQLPQDSGRPNAAQPPVVAGRVLNQPSRTGTGPPLSSNSPALMNDIQEDDADPGMPLPGTGFFSARAAVMVPEVFTAEDPPQAAPQNLPAFNPKLESPSIRKTPGIDYKGSRPVSKDLKQLPGYCQAAAGPPSMRPNLVNPLLDATRKIGAPGSLSPMANRGQYKPPSMKRPVDSNGGQPRVPLTDLPANGALGVVETGVEAKRQRLDN